MLQGHLYPHIAGRHCRRHGPEGHHERTAPHLAGVYTEADAHTLEEILAAKEQGMDALEALMLPVESVFESLPLLVVEPWVEQHLYNGCPPAGIRQQMAATGCAMPPDSFWALPISYRVCCGWKNCS